MSTWEVPDATAEEIAQGYVDDETPSSEECPIHYGKCEAWS